MVVALLVVLVVVVVYMASSTSVVVTNSPVNERVLMVYLVTAWGFLLPAYSSYKQVVGVMIID